MFVAPALPVAEFHPTLVTSGVMRPSQRRWPIIAGGAGLFCLAVMLGILLMSPDPAPAPAALVAIPTASAAATAVRAEPEVPSSSSESTQDSERDGTKAVDEAPALPNGDEDRAIQQEKKAAGRAKSKSPVRKTGSAKKKDSVAGIDLDNPYK
jgi:hypothetical protein